MSVSLQFPLVVEDDWPPVGSESLPFENFEKVYKCLLPPLFVKDLSVDDVIEIEKDAKGFISLWTHVSRSCRSTIWLAKLQDNDQIEPRLQDLRLLGCNTTRVEQFGCYAVDVPENLSIAEVEKILETLDRDLVAVAFPSMRHPE